MVFENASFIKPKECFYGGFSERNPSPIYYKRFYLDKKPGTAALNICALGIGYAYINSKKVSPDLFVAPPSNYEKRLRYTSYDVTDMLCEGENTIAVITGNGFFNEDMKNAWGSTEASWRDYPKLIAELTSDGIPIISTDESWLYTLTSPYLMNRYREGVCYDSRISAPDSPDFYRDDFKAVMVDDRAPAGEFTPYLAEPIRELEVIKPISMRVIDDTRRILDFGVNISGYVRLVAEGAVGTTVTLKYAETLTEDGMIFEEAAIRKLNFYDGDFATERFICNGNRVEWSTLFSYYGFRYVEIHCEDGEAIKDASAVFVAQDLKRRAGFECSDPFLNRLYECGIRATVSNLFYMPTDCPTREKYGWMNDAQASAEQILTNFHAENMLLSWNLDICDALTDEKGLPGIVPTHGWGYHWGNGPVSDGSLFEQVYRVYLHSGDASGLIHNLPYFRRYLAFLKSREDGEGLVDLGLYDWANPYKERTTPTTLINEIYRVKFNRIAAIAARLAGENAREFLDGEARAMKTIKEVWLNSNGSCKVDTQTALAMLLYHKAVSDTRPIATQLAAAVEREGFHHRCGMVGIRHLYMALSGSGLDEYAYKIVTAGGFPSYREWIDRGATTLWEMWDSSRSKNHHMYSDVLSWLMKRAAGISPDDNAESYREIEIRPHFFEKLDYVRAFYDSPRGRVCVEWKRETGGIRLTIDSPISSYVKYGGALLSAGKTEIFI